MTRIDRLDPRHKLYISSALLALLTTALGWWLLAQIGQSHGLADQALRHRAGPGSVAAAGLRAHYSHVLLIGWLGVGAVAVCAALLGRWLSEELTRPLREATEIAVRVGAGDLSARVCSDGQGEDARLIRALQDMNDQLAARVSALRAGFDDMVKGAGGIAVGQGKLATQAERQLAALKHGSGALQQMNEALALGSAQAQAATLAAAGAARTADDGVLLAEQMAAALAGASHTALGLKTLSDAVEDIAFHTNMLALSAAVEAARAGEPGAGAGVLAHEARLLAQRSQVAARAMRTLHEQADTNAGQGVALGARAGAAMREVAGGVRQVSRMVDAVAVANAKHGAALATLDGALSGLTRTCHDTGAMVEQSAKVAATLRDRAGALARMLAAFRLTRIPPRAGAHMYLAASNPDLITRPFKERRGRARIAAVKP